MFKYFPIFLFLFLIPINSFAAVSEICGDGIDDSLATGGAAAGTKGSCPAGFMDPIIGLGCDRKCPGVDADDDGYTSDGSPGNAGVSSTTDCDDTRKDVYPGAYVPDSFTSPTGYKLCQTNGTYGSTVLNSVTPLCQATGSGVCKYIHCTSGNDATGNGTYALPWKTGGKISGGSAGSPPASPYSVNGDDFIYFIGGVCNTTMVSGAGENVIFDLTRSGTAGHVVTIANYPGADTTFANTAGSVINNSGAYYNYIGLNVSADAGGTANGNGALITGSHHHFSRVYFHDTQSAGSSNGSCIVCSHTNDCQIDHSWTKDCDVDNGNTQGTTHVKWVDDDNIATECQDHSLTFSTLWETAFDETKNGQCVRQKHGCDAGDVGANKHIIKWNTFINCTSGIWSNSSSFRIIDNTFAASGITTGNSAIKFFFDGDSGPEEDNQIKFNTFLDYGDGLSWNEPWYGNTSDEIQFDHNVVRDSRNPYQAGNADGTLTIDAGGSGAHQTQFESNQYLIPNNNCYYNPNTALVFSYFRGAGGGDFTFTQWKALVDGSAVALNYDSASFVENPTFDNWLQATSAHCTGLGRRYSTATTTTVTTTTTSTTTASTTTLTTTSVPASVGGALPAIM